MNKMFKKIVATTAAVSTVACLSVSAFAATADYDKDTQKVKLTDWAASGDGQYTIVVVPKTWDGSDDDIYYINQDSETGMATLVNGMGVKTDLYALADAEADDTAEFQVWVGSDVAGYTIAKFDFTVSAKAPTPQGEEVQLGDTTGEGAVNVSDINPIIQHILGSSTLTGKVFFAADTTGEGTVNVSDINPVIQHILGSATLGKGIYIAE